MSVCITTRKRMLPSFGAKEKHTILHEEEFENDRLFSEGRHEFISHKSIRGE